MNEHINKIRCFAICLILRFNILNLRRHTNAYLLKTGIIFTIAISLLSSCTTPLTQYSNLAKNFGFKRSTVDERLFEHVIFSNNAVVNMQSSQALHIYIEGDGTPWINGRWIAKDPTPRKAVMLELMNLDQEPAILLGRPCYHQKIENTSCVSDDWTMGRYSTKVVSSMVHAIKALQRQLGFSEILLFGHSGGGVLATLIADLLKSDTPKIHALVTIGSNLDTDAWTASNGYLPLKQSSNPALLPALSSTSITLHLFGSEDQVVDYKLFKNYLTARPWVESIIYEGFDHSCCWSNVWPQILNRVQATQNSPLNPAVSE